MLCNELNKPICAREIGSQKPLAFFWRLLRFMKELVEVNEIFSISTRVGGETKGQLLTGKSFPHCVQYLLNHYQC